MKNSQSSADVNPLVFVYGTLKRGCHNHGLLQRTRAEFISTGRTASKFPLVVDGLPYLLDMPGKGHRVEGEIYRVNSAEGWSALDRLEGHPRFYQRRLTEIAGDDRETYAAWVSSWHETTRGSRRCRLCAPTGTTASLRQRSWLQTTRFESPPPTARSFPRKAANRPSG